MSDDRSPSTTVRVRTPDGTMFVTIAEQNGAPRHILITIGKSGTRIQAWADSLARMMTLALRSGLDIFAILQEVSGITSANNVIHPSGVNIRSGPEGVAYAIMTYNREKNREQREQEGDLDDGGFRAQQ